MSGRYPKRTKRAMDREVERYLRTGNHDHDFVGWPGRDYLSRVTAGKQAMEDALVRRVRQLESGRTLTELPADFDA